MNQVQLIGRAGSDAEIRYTEKGMAVLNVSIATSKRIKDSQEYKTTWHRVVCFGKTAEAMSQRIKKGSEVLILGEIDYNEWTDKNGNKQKSTTIIGNIVKVIESAPKADKYDQSQTPSVLSKTPTQARQSIIESDLTEDDIPF